MRLRYKILVSLPLLVLAMNLSAQQSMSAVSARIKAIDQLYTTQPDLATKQTYQWYDSLKANLIIEPEDEGDIYYALCKYEFRRYNYKEAFKICKKGVVHLDKYDIKDGLGGFYNILGTSFAGTNQLDSAIYYFIKAADNLLSLGDIVKAGYIYNNLGNVYFDNQDFKKALPYLKKSLVILEDQGDTINIVIVKGNVSYCYVMLDSLIIGEQVAREAIVMGQKYNVINGVVYGYLSLADIKNKQIKTKEAIAFALKGYNYAIINTDEYYKGLCASSLAGYYLNSDPKLTIMYGEEALRIFKETEPRFIPQLQVTLANAYMQTGDFKKAAVAQKEYITYIDSTKKETYNRTQLELLEKFESAEKSRTIAEQQNAIFKKDLYLSQLGIALLLMILVLGIGFWWFKNNQLKNKIRFKQLTAEKEIQIAQASIMGEAQERERLAKELHDGVSNDIASSKLLVSTYRMINNDSNDILSKLESELDQLHKNTRAMAHNLLPQKLLADGLQSALHTLISSNTSKIDISLDLEDYKVGKSQSLELYIYRIVQEMMMNAIKHSQASKILCKMEDDGKNLTIIVQDNGIGMSYENQSDGLLFLRSRISDLGGKLMIESSENNGTQLVSKFAYGV